MDLGVHLKPTAYSLRHARGYGKSAVRSWDFEGSMDNKNYFVLSQHRLDKSLNECGSTATFFLEDAAKGGASLDFLSISNTLYLDKTIRYVRIQQRGFNASDMTHYLSLSGFEIYGEIVDVVSEPLTIPLESSLVPKPSSGSTSRAMRLQQQMFPPRPSGSDRSGKESKSKSRFAC